MRLYLHIGAGKCGSTTVQDYLAAEAPALARLGYGQSDVAGAPHAWKLAVYNGAPATRDYWITKRGKLTEADFDAVKARLWPDLEAEVARLKAEGHHSLILSSEFLYGHNHTPAEIGALRAGLAPLFDQITVIFYCRDQLALIKSLYGQGVRGPMQSTQSFAQFLQEVSAERYHFNFYVTLQHWADVFGDAALRVGVVDPAYLRGGDLISDFLAKLDLPAEAAEALPRPKGRSNASPSYGSLRALRWLNIARARWPFAAPVLGPLNRLALSRLGAALGRRYPPLEEARIRQMFAPSNRAFRARFLPGQEGPQGQAAKGKPGESAAVLPIQARP